MTLNELTSAIDELRALTWGRGTEPSGPRALAMSVAALQERMHAWNALPAWQQIGPGTTELHAIGEEYTRLRAAAAAAGIAAPPPHDPVIDDMKASAAASVDRVLDSIGDALPWLLLLGLAIFLASEASDHDD